MFSFNFKFNKLSELTKRFIVGAIGLSALFLVHYFEMSYHLLSILFFVLYSELLITSYDSKIAFFKKALVFAFGLLYMVMGLQALMDAVAMEFVVPLFLIVCAQDIASYFMGKHLKGPKLAPKISPNKTWAGAIAGLIVGAGLFQYFLAPLIFIDRCWWMELLDGVAFALAVQFGDLLVSFAKRVCKVKDSSSLLPGYGGVWDRFDGIFAGAIFVSIVRIILFGIEAGV